MILLTIPRIPAGPNGRGGLFRQHYQARRRDRIMWEQEILAARRADGRYVEKATTFRDVTIHQIRKRKLDPDNLYASCKHVLDALVTGGLIVDDSPGWIALRVTQETGREQRTEIRIEEKES